MIWGLVVATCVGGVAASPVAAQTPNPEPLWNAYPLDDSQAGAGQSGSGAGQSGAGAGRSGSAGPSQSGSTAPAASPAGATTQLTDEAGDGPPWLLMAAAAAGGALFVALLLVLQGRRARRRAPDLAGPVADEWPWLKPTPQRGAREVRVERLKEPANGADRQPSRPFSLRLEPTFDIAEAVAVPRRRFDREAQPPNGRAAPSRRGPICQVRWSHDDACFYAVTTDAAGAEERVAHSPSFEWDGPEPPDEESREARAALRVLSKELRDHGWRPMRVKGTDYDEQRWYARRFRLPVTEEEGVRTPQSGSARA